MKLRAAEGPVSLVFIVNTFNYFLSLKNLKVLVWLHRATDKHVSIVRYTEYRNIFFSSVGYDDVKLQRIENSLFHHNNLIWIALCRYRSTFFNKRRAKKKDKDKEKGIHDHGTPSVSAQNKVTKLLPYVSISMNRNILRTCPQINRTIL